MQTVDAATLKRWIDTGEAVLVDVREPAEHAAEHIPEATLLPLSRLARSALPSCEGKKLVIHCRKGGRGGTACDKLLREDPSLDIYNLAGGIEAWAGAGLPVKRSGRFMLPLDRQVLLVAGLCVLVGTVLGYMVDPRFLLLAGFFGAGLTFAGLTGFCGLALLLARMPWNKGSSCGCAS